MHNIGILLKNYFKIYIGSLNRTRNKKNVAKGGSFVLIIAFIYLFIFCNMAFTTISEAQKAGDITIALYVQLTMALMFGALVVILRCGAETKASDFDFLSSLPFKKEEIIIAKVLREFLFDFAIIVITILPGFIIYFYYSGCSFSLILWGIVISICLTLFANAISSFLRLIAVNITRHFKNGKIIQSMFAVALTILFMGFYFYFNNSLYNIESDALEKISSFYPVSLLFNLAVYSSIKSLGILLLVSFTSFILSIFILVKNIDKSMSTYHTTSNIIIYKKKPIFLSLLKKESLRYFNCSVYVINTIIGAFMLILIAVLLKVVGIQYILNLLVAYKLDYLSNCIPAVVVIILSLISATIITTSSSISLEGKNFWILKANPISPRDIFLAKIGFNVILAFPFILIASVIVASVIGFKYLGFLIIIPLLSCLLAACMGLYFNLLYPKLEWTDESVPIKRGMATVISLAVALIPNILILILLIILASSFQINFAYLFLILFLLLIFNFFAIILLRIKGTKLFDKIF